MKKNERKEIEFKDITQDFTEEINENKSIIIFVKHSKSYVLEYAFNTFISKRLNHKGDKYVVACANLDFITPENMSPSKVSQILKEDLDKVYNDFKARYPNAILAKPFAINYAIDYSEKTNNAEIMAIAAMRSNNDFTKIEISPIVGITKEQYDMLIGKDKTEEGILLNDILMEKRMGIEQFGLIGYLTNGKMKTYNMYMEALYDLIYDYEKKEKFRPKVLNYKNYRATKSAYLFSIKTEEEKKTYIDEGNESIV